MIMEFKTKFNVWEKCFFFAHGKILESTIGSGQINFYASNNKDKWSNSPPTSPEFSHYIYYTLQYRLDILELWSHKIPTNIYGYASIELSEKEIFKSREELVKHLIEPKT